MDAVERGDRFTVTRHGHQIGELIPLRRRRRFVSREEFAEASRLVAGFDPDRLRAEQEAAAEDTLTDPYER